VSGPKADNLPWPALPGERFAIAAIDPPWHYQVRGQTSEPDKDRSPQRHYPTADVEHLCTLPMQEMLAKDAWVALWMTGPLYATGVQLELARAWGLEISGQGFVWIKLWNDFDMGQLARTPLLEQDLALGGGYTTRKNAEFVVLLRKGKPPVGRRDIREVIVSPRREHSRKPNEFYRRMEHFAPGPRLDIFGGQVRTGWTYWGFPHWVDGEREALA
jgi:N6-adenosine-specific RNA methylase IME4